MGRAALKTLSLVLGLVSAVGRPVAAQAVVAGVVTDKSGIQCGADRHERLRVLRACHDILGRMDGTDSGFTGTYEVTAGASGFGLTRQFIDTAKSSWADFN